MAKIILTTDVAHLGEPGDIVEVKDGYARNYLLPRGYAIRSTKGAERTVAEIRRAQEARRIRDLDHAKEIKQTLEGLGEVPVQAKAAKNSNKLFGSITPADVATAVKQAGGPQLDKRTIQLDGHIKSVGPHPVSVRLHPDVTASFQVAIHPAG
ncbi:50S ribosomal protein L9 [Haloechinothrix sp. YIM 98757]|uniref:Large ribosomal subunit protein bL9 n=1 Tax=Haloechinothrix aidingensis TaxID=2752311 RepID=A0A837ZTT5_9PSEU|nr:50S ribosomal protein L9 [Haloechinothrix aidingensis]MBA0123986.1 50S ribosomal protein L9 [Haloechinothrix aidingensis]